MGMDIFWQPFDSSGKELGERQDMRCRGVYHAVNDWLTKNDESTPENGERVSFDDRAWADIAPSIREAIVTADLDFPDSTPESAQALGDEWMQLIWPKGTWRVEYWFTV